MDRVAELRSVSEAERERMLYPSPLTPAYIKASLATKRQTFGDEDVEDACRSFENYLVEMMVEEGKVRDLADVKSFCIAGKTSSVLSSLVWSADSTESYARTCSLLMLTTPTLIVPNLPNDSANSIAVPPLHCRDNPCPLRNPSSGFSVDSLYCE
uniref:Uncharacterized protein n=2 Tax=Populus trichocarpa TaxID=3694 RepID=A9PA88_POPTR|nr:unknown [Populus trichocarpa]